MNSLATELCQYNDEYAILKSIRYQQDKCFVTFVCPIYRKLTVTNFYKFFFSTKFHFSAPCYLITICFFGISVNIDSISPSELYKNIKQQNFEYEIDNIDYTDDSLFIITSSYEDILSINYNKYHIDKSIYAING